MYFGAKKLKIIDIKEKEELEPMVANELEKEIRRIGEALVNCSNNCAGVVNDKSKGILPRCLVLEVNNRKKSRGAIIVGINPGHAKEWERREFRSDPTYDALLDCWNKNEIHPYRRRLSHFIKEMGFSGPILWTNLAKCETEKNRRIPLRPCVFVPKSIYTRNWN